MKYIIRMLGYLCGLAILLGGSVIVGALSAETLTPQYAKSTLEAVISNLDQVADQTALSALVADAELWLSNLNNPVDQSPLAPPITNPESQSLPQISAPNTQTITSNETCATPTSASQPSCTDDNHALNTALATPHEQAQEKVHHYSLAEIRQLILTKLSQEIGSNSPIDPNECSIAIEQNNILRLSCKVAVNQWINSQLVAQVSVYTANGQPAIAILSVTIAGQSLDIQQNGQYAALITNIESAITSSLHSQLKADLNYTTLVSIDANSNGLVVSYH